MLKEVLNDLRARIRAGRQPHNRGSYTTQTKPRLTLRLRGGKDKWGSVPQESVLDIAIGVKLAFLSAQHRVGLDLHIWGHGARKNLHVGVISN